jgi:succinyl-CoA synthetase beta subunit
MSFDDNALFRHADVGAARSTRGRPARDEAAKYDLSYIALDGNIGCMVNGAGPRDGDHGHREVAGGEPANFLDVGGGADREGEGASRIILSDAA